MARSREAISTIKGYYYQFDYFILQLLSCKNRNGIVVMEGIEDIDVIDEWNTNAIQCKYYEGTRCMPSVIGKAVRPMLRHFTENKNSDICYSVYGYYESGQETIPDSITVKFAKEKLFTYKADGVKHILHDELQLEDGDIEAFLKKLNIQVRAESYEDQMGQVISGLCDAFNCSAFEAKYFYYNNALRFVKDVAVKSNIAERKIKKKDFLKEINKKQVIFDRWYAEYIGFEKYYREVRSEYFSHFNIEFADRFFMIQCDMHVTDRELLDIIARIKKNWSNTSKRKGKPFCPYIYFDNMKPQRLKRIKELLLKNGIHIWDGYEFHDADFSIESVMRPINAHMDVSIKIIDKTEDVKSVLQTDSNPKEVYQFYTEKPFFDRRDYIGADIQVQRTEDVMKIV